MAAGRHSFGVSEHRYKTLYSGDIDVSIYEAKPMKLRLRDFPVDEFVTVISGKLILTPMAVLHSILMSGKACWCRKASPGPGNAGQFSGDGR